MSSNLVIAAIPDENDRVWKVSSEKIPHLTVLFLGDVDKISNLEQIMLFVEHAANTTLQRFYLPVDRRGELGDDKADVLFFKKGRYDYKAIRDFRAVLLKDPNIKTAYDSATQFDGPWTPHLTLGYPETPAKPEPGEYGSFYDVQFNKIAVWTGDFEGPDFLLKDYWDEMEALDCVPMDVAMSDIEHHGVRGMHWGVRKEDVGSAAKSVGSGAKKAAKGVGKAVSGAAKRIGDVNFENRVIDGKAREKVIQTANPQFRKMDLPAIKAKPEHQKAAKLKNRLRNPRDPGTKAYRKDVRETYVKRLETTANSMQNPSGTRQYTIRERGNDLPAQGGALPASKYFWDVSTRNVVHAAEDDFTTLEVILDDDGFVTDVNKVEKSLAQTAELGVEFLEHHGVRGMHWGVTTRSGAKAVGSGAKVAGRGAKKVGKGLVTIGKDTAFESTNRMHTKTNEVHLTASKNFKEQDIPRINAKYKDTKGGTLKGRLKNPLHPDTRAYRSESRIAYRDRVNEAVKALPGNASGTRKYEIDDHGKTNAQYGWTLKAVDVKKTVQHADPNVPLLDEFTVRPVFDADGFITDVKMVGATLAQTVDLGIEFLEHYGIRGMHWGVRKERAVTTQTHIDSGIARRQTKIRATGGAAHPAAPEAIKAAVSKQKLKKSGVAALSNHELRELQTRLQLETQVQQLTSSKGKKVVAKQLEEEGKQQLSRGIRKSAPIAFKKASKGAATVATTAALL